MKSPFIVAVFFGLVFAGCGPKENPPPTKAPPATPPSTKAAMPSLDSTPTPPPPPAGATAAAAPVADITSYEGKDEAEKLTKALHAYYERSGAEAPLITSLEGLVKAGYLKSVPVPPAGKKYVVTTQYPFQVRLESK